jgi:ADP-ribose pyrophosphatase
MHTNPWKIKSKTTVYQNAWIEVFHHEVINPSGGEGIYGTVHFNNLAIGILPIDENGNTYLVGQYRFPLEEYSWEIPMGGGLLTESRIVSAQRELKEEVGLLANKWEELLKIHTSNSVCDEVGYVYLATELTQVDASPEETEELIVRKLPLQEAIEMALNGKITDSLSLAALLKAQLWINAKKLNL